MTQNPIIQESQYLQKCASLTNSNANVGVTCLPNDLFRSHVFDHLNDLELMCLRNVNKFFYSLIEPPLISCNISINRVQLLNWAKDNNCPWRFKITMDAAHAGNLEILKWCETRQYPIYTNIFTIAIEKDYEDIIEWRKETRGAWDYQACSMAVKKGNFTLLFWLHINGHPWDIDTLKSAVHVGNLDDLKWLLKNKCPWDPELVAVEAAQYNHVRILEWLHDQGHRFNSEVCSAAAKNGHTKLLEWLREKRTRWNEKTSAYAIRYGHEVTFNWAISNGCPYGIKTCIAAAKGNNLPVLKWLHARGTSIKTTKICVAAAKIGNLELLEWAHDNGSPLDELVFTNAIQNGHFEIVQWLHANRCPWSYIDLICLAEDPVKYGHILCWLFDVGYPVDTQPELFFIVFGSNEALEGALERGYDRRRMCEIACQYGQLEKLLIARKYKCPLDVVKCIKIAKKNGHSRVLNWLRKLDH